MYEGHAKPDGADYIVWFTPFHVHMDARNAWLVEIRERQILFRASTRIELEI